MAKIENFDKKTNVNDRNINILPIQGYMSSIVSRDERTDLKIEIMHALGVRSDVSFWRYIVGRTQRPSYAQREAVAEVIRQHSGNESYTGEDLFPEALYPSNLS